MPCLTYNFSVYTLNRGQRSETGETAKVLTSKSLTAFEHFYKLIRAANNKIFCFKYFFYLHRKSGFEYLQKIVIKK